MYLLVSVLLPAQAPKGPTESADSPGAPASQNQVGGEQAPLQGMCLSVPNVAWPWNPATSLLHRGSGEAGLISLGGFGPFLESQPSDLWQVLPHQRRGPLHHLWGHSCHKHQKLWDRG